MSLHPHAPRLPHAHEPISRSTWLIAAVLIVAVAVALYFLRTTAFMPAPADVSPPVAAVDPAQQGVMDYIAAHGAVMSAATFDSAQQGVMDYIAAHSAVMPAVAFDSAQQGVMGYIAAHSAVPYATAAFDPAQQAVMDYIRLHSR